MAPVEGLSGPMSRTPMPRRPVLGGRLRAVGVLTALAVAATACGGDSGTADTPAGETGDEQFVSGGTLTYAVGEDPGALDPHMSVLSVTRGLAKFAYDTLVHTDADGEIVSGLAESWEVGENSVTYTLREGITCADGSPLTASDVAANFEFVADPANASPVLGLFVPAGVTATADDEARTVTLSTTEPVPFLLRTTGQLLIVCGKGLEDRSLLERETLGTGPFVLEESVPNDHYTFARREDYAWGPDGSTNEEEGVPEEVVVRVVPNASTAMNLLLSGEVEVTAGTDAEARRAQEAGLYSEGLEAPTGELWFNQDPGLPGSDIAVRQALVGVLDEEELGTVMTGGQSVPSRGLVTLEPPVCEGDTVEGNLPQMSVEEAAQMLEEAGWTEGPDGVRSKDGTPLQFTFLVSSATGETGVAGAELLAQTWEQLGARVEIVNEPDTALQTRLFASGDWDAGIIPVTVSLPTQYAPFVSGPTPPDGTNFAQIQNEEYEAAYAEAAALPDDEACAAYTEGEEALITQADVAPLFNSEALIFANGARFRLADGGLVPQSLRLVEQE